jgi:hypothetical protein
MPTRQWNRGAVAALLLVGAMAAPVSSQVSLPIGATTAMRVPPGGSAEMEYEATGAGFLAVVVRSTGGEDVRIAVTDAEYQALPEGEGDDDLNGDVGAEQLLVTIPYPGTYRVLVETFGGGGAFIQVGGMFLASDLAARPPDPDGRPSTAVELAVGATHEGSIEPSNGDSWDWYRLPIEVGGILTVFTRAEEGDLRLDLHEDGAFREAVNSSDQDLDGVYGNESLTWDVSAGSVVFVRVSPAMGAGDRVTYRIGSGVIPE